MSDSGGEESRGQKKGEERKRGNMEGKDRGRHQQRDNGKVYPEVPVFQADMWHRTARSWPSVQCWLHVMIQGKVWLRIKLFGHR